MNRQQQIEAFLLEAHRLAVARLKAEPERLRDVATQLARWRARAGSTASDVYWDEWERLIESGVSAIEEGACGDGEHAATLRSMSPMSVLITQSERSVMLRQARVSS